MSQGQSGGSLGAAESKGETHVGTVQFKVQASYLTWRQLPNRVTGRLL
jgi:hypothetical protein